MRRTLAIDLLLGIALEFYRAQANQQMVGYIERVIFLKRSGTASVGTIDAHMQSVADRMIAGEQPDIPDLIDRINSEVDEAAERGGLEVPEFTEITADDEAPAGDGSGPDPNSPSPDAKASKKATSKKDAAK